MSQTVVRMPCALLCFFVVSIEAMFFASLRFKLKTLCEFVVSRWCCLHHHWCLCFFVQTSHPVRITLLGGLETLFKFNFWRGKNWIVMQECRHTDIQKFGNSCEVLSSSWLQTSLGNTFADREMQDLTAFFCSSTSCTLPKPCNSG